MTNEELEQHLNKYSRAIQDRKVERAKLFYAGIKLGCNVSKDCH
ncbi:hypothetical protein [Acinetobacter phage Ab69]|nr:hypothetical protein [Acinetobacter phage Ab69]